MYDSLSGIQIIKFQETILLIIQYRYLIIVRKTKCSKIWSSAQDYSVLVLFLNMVESFISVWPKWSILNDFYQSCNCSKGKSVGWPILIFTWLTGSGGLGLQINRSATVRDSFLNLTWLVQRVPTTRLGRRLTLLLVLSQIHLVL